MPRHLGWCMRSQCATQYALYSPAGTGVYLHAGLVSFSDLFSRVRSVISVTEGQTEDGASVLHVYTYAERVSRCT